MPLPQPAGPIGTDNTAFLGTLCNLRWLAIACQAITVLVVTRALMIDVSAMPMWLAIASLAAFNLYATVRVRYARPVAHHEVFAHIVIDVAVLAWLIAWGGGITNPFTSLFLLPIAFAALALPLPWMFATAALCTLGYALSALLGRGLPHMHGGVLDTFNLHLSGMVVNFLISLVVVVYFLSRLAGTLRQREQELARVREKFTRNEGIIALATHAASVAHEMNTPLATLTIVLDDLIEAEDRDEVAADLRSMRAIVDVCRDRVRTLASPADAAGSAAMDAVSLQHVIERWQLVRPTIELIQTGQVPAHTQVDPAVGHLLQALLNNAADAGEEAGIRRVELHLDADAEGVRGEIRDHGAGLSQARAFLPGTLFASSKSDGMGVGLVLSHATVERLGGELSMQANGETGLRVSFQLPANGGASA